LNVVSPGEKRRKKRGDIIRKAQILQSWVNDSSNHNLYFGIYMYPFKKDFNLFLAKDINNGGIDF
jgi:hypothetical protein